MQKSTWGKLRVILNDGTKWHIPFRLCGNDIEIDTQIKHHLTCFGNNYPDGKMICSTDDGDIERGMRDIEMIMMVRDDTGKIACIDFTSDEREVCVSE